MTERPAWLDGLTHKDWLFDGQPIRGGMVEMWDQLDWSQAWVDLGPSPSGNPGPYWKVPLRGADTVHRLYPKVLTGKWLNLIRRACEEVAAKADSGRLTAENNRLTVELATARIRIAALSPPERQPDGVNGQKTGGAS